jgi:hypothetical protein
VNLYRTGTLVYIILILAVNGNDSKAGLPSLSGDHSNARGIGMGSASIVSSFGVNAFGVNPANYYDYQKSTDLEMRQIKLTNKQQKPQWEFSFLSAGGSYGSDQSLNFYNNYLKYLSINRQTFTGIFTDFTSVLNFRQNILPAERTQVNYDLEVRWLSVNYSNPKIGAINFTVADNVALNTDSYSRDEELPFIFHINSYNGKYDLTNIHINQAEASAWWIRKYSLSYAKEFEFPKNNLIKNISFGVSLGLVNGFGNIITYNTALYVNTYGVIKDPVTGINHVDSITGKQDFHTQTALTDFFTDYRDGAHSHFNFFPKPAGKGYSVDLGINIKIGEKWRVAASVTDLGKILWDYNTFINNDTNQFAYYNFYLNSSDPTYNTFINDLDGISTRISNKSFKTDMPTKYRAGIMFQPSEKVTLEADWQKGKNNLPGNSDRNIVSGGAEYYLLNFLPVRAGFSTGGPGGFYFALGAGLKLRHIELDLASGGINQFLLNKRLSISFSSKITL